jgi:hypothetical protein
VDLIGASAKKDFGIYTGSLRRVLSRLLIGENYVITTTPGGMQILLEPSRALASAAPRAASASAAPSSQNSEAAAPAPKQSPAVIGENYVTSSSSAGGTRIVLAPSGELADAAPSSQNSVGTPAPNQAPALDSDQPLSRTDALLQARLQARGAPVPDE